MNKTRKVGLRFRKISEPNSPAVAVMQQSGSLVEIFDIESGESLECHGVKVHYEVSGILEATVSFYPVVQDVV